MSRIKIIHVVPDLGIGGTQRVVLDICFTADLSVYELCIFMLNKNDALLRAYDLPGDIRIRYFSYSYSDDYGLNAYLRDFYFPQRILEKASELIEEAVKENPGIMHFHTNIRELPIGTAIAKKTGAKLIFTQHLSVFNEKSIGLKILAKGLRRHYRKYHSIAVSQEVYSEISDMKLKGKNKLSEKIENRINLNMYEPKKQAHDHIQVVYVARLSHVKAHDDLVNAWAQLPVYPFDIKLVLAGPDDMGNQVQELCRQLNIEKQVEFTGPLSQVSTVLSASDIAVFPSRNEGLPIALLEKMAFGLPVIVSDIPALTCIIKNEHNGLVFKQGDTKGLAEQLNRLITDAGLRNKLGKMARQTIEESYGSYNVAATNEMFYQKVLNSPH